MIVCMKMTTRRYNLQDVSEGAKLHRGPRFAHCSFDHSSRGTFKTPFSSFLSSCGDSGGDGDTVYTKISACLSAMVSSHNKYSWPSG
jgi:hypothetical protein